MCKSRCVNELLQAVKEGQLEAVSKLLDANSDLIGASDSIGQTPLHIACLQNDLDMVKFLLSKNADFELKNNLDQSSIDIAIDFGYFGIIKLFLRQGKDKYINRAKLVYLLRMAVVLSDFLLLSLIIERDMTLCLETDETGESIIHFCVEKRNFTALSLLVDEGAKVNCKNSRGQIPLHIASRLNLLKIGRLLLDCEPETVNYQDSDGNTPLHFTAENDDGTFTKELITKGAKINMTNVDGMTPLHLTVHYLNEEVFHELLHLTSIDVNAKNKDGNTPLHLAVSLDAFGFSDDLICNGANVNEQNNYGQHPLHIAFDHNFYYTLNFFFTLPSLGLNSLDTQDLNGNTLLHLAANHDNYRGIDDLVSRGATLDLTNCNGQTPLHVAIQRDCHQAFDRLIYHGANVNIKDGEGKSPLHVAVCRGVLSAVGRLVNSGSDLEVRDNYGQTPIHYAANCQSLEVLKYLYFSGSETKINFHSQTLIHVALQSCPFAGVPDRMCRKCWYIIDWLLYMGVDINAQDMKGETALHYGARFGNLSLLKHLREQEVKNCEILLDIQNEDGQTALHLAASYSWSIFDHLLGENADPDSKDYRGVTPFEILNETFERVVNGETEDEPHDQRAPLVKSITHYFVSARLLNITELFLNRNTSIETKHDGDTLLMYAVGLGMRKETQFLLERGADVSVKNAAGLTALHVAVEKSETLKSYVNIAHILMVAGADVNVKTPDGKTPLHLALAKERVYPFLLRNLLDNGAILDVVDSTGKTPLDYISEDNYENPLIKTLLRHNLIMLKAVNMLSISADFPYNGFEDFHKCCLEEIEMMQAEKYGRHSLSDVFFRYGNPTYIFNQTLEAKVNSFNKNENETYPIYGFQLRHTFKRAKRRYKLLQNAQGFFGLLKVSSPQLSLPDEVQRIILYNLSDNDLEALVRTFS